MQDIASCDRRCLSCTSSGASVASGSLVRGPLAVPTSRPGRASIAIDLFHVETSLIPTRPMSSLTRRVPLPRTPEMPDPTEDLHWATPTYLLVSHPAATPLFTFCAIFFLGLTAGVVTPALRDWYHGEDTPGTRFWISSAISLLFNGLTCARLRGRFVHEIAA